MDRPRKRARLEVSDSDVEKVHDLHDFQLTDMPDAEVFYVPHFIDEEVALEWYTGLLNLESCMRSVSTDNCVYIHALSRRV